MINQDCNFYRGWDVCIVKKAVKDTHPITTRDKLNGLTFYKTHRYNCDFDSRMKCENCHWFQKGLALRELANMDWKE